MKKIKVFVATILFSAFTQAQEYTHSLSGIEWVKIESKSELEVRTHSASDLKIQGGMEDKTPEKAKGLKLVGEGGTDNTGIGYFVEKDGSTLVIKNLLKNNQPNSIIYLPAGQNISVTSTGLNNIVIEGFQGEIEVTSRVTGNIDIQDVTGPITAHSNTGNVDIIFGKVSQSSPISVTTATGDVDISMPSSTPANLEMNSTMGNIYTNFDINVPDKDGLKAVSAQKVAGAINNGGVAIQLNTATGNIYLRKN